MNLVPPHIDRMISIAVLVLFAIIASGCVEPQQKQDIAPQNNTENQGKDLRSNASAVNECTSKGFTLETETLCLIGKASSLKDPSICEGISLPSSQSDCYTSVAKSTASVQICDKINITSWKSTCYIAVAKSKSDAGICGRLTTFQGDVDYSGSCYSEMAKITKDYRICNKISSDNKKPCLIELAKLTGDITPCKEIVVEPEKTDVSKDLCYKEAAIASNDEEICSQMSEDSYGQKNEFKAQCLMKIAYEKNDEKICEKIAINSYRASCIVSLKN